MRLDQAQFAAAFEAFVAYVTGAAQWTRVSRETYHHSGSWEVGCWLGSGVDERGVVFSADVATWDGKFETEKIDRVLSNPLPIKYGERSVAYFLSPPSNHSQKERRCRHCGHMT